MWMIVLTVIVFRFIQHYNRLTDGESKTKLTEILDTILETQTGLKKRVADQATEIHKLQTEGLLHIQQLGIVRFNPFSDTGGSQSFILALLDGQDNGIVMTSLYARTGNRWYIKKVRKGKGVDLELSKEEQSAIKNARPLIDLS